MYSRRPKESHRDTITYEIDMLGFCARAVTARKHSSELDLYVYLEAFLLHYRNLIRFFSGEHHRQDDLSTADHAAWSARDITSDEVRLIRDQAKALDAKYYQPISKYLQHCTRERHDHDRGWDVEGMLSDVCPIIEAFEHVFPR
jgi:hypothetical protein